MAYFDLAVWWASDTKTGAISLSNPHQPTAREWDVLLAPYKRPKLGKSLFQLLNTCLLFVGLWWLMWKSLDVSYALTFLLVLPAAAMVCRLFIIQHDCGHGSFFRSRTANRVVGTLLGIVTLTPFDYWRRTHAMHHATSGDLDRRELGDIATLTVDEYLARPRLGRFLYRLYRSAPVLFVIGPLYQFVLKHRFPFDAPRSWKREWISVGINNLGILAGVLLMIRLVGWKPFLLVHAPIITTMCALGVWLFYVQHQFERAYWERHESWDQLAAGLHGSSYYDLPRVLHWATGNIGYHHIHHLSSMIPNYRLRECQENIPAFHEVPRLSIRESLKTPRLKLWDEANRALIGFRELAQMRRSGALDRQTA